MEDNPASSLPQGKQYRSEYKRIGTGIRDRFDPSYG